MQGEKIAVPHVRSPFDVRVYFDYPVTAGQPPAPTAAQVLANVIAGFAADTTLPAQPTVEVFVPAGSGE